MSCKSTILLVRMISWLKCMPDANVACFIPRGPSLLSDPGSCCVQHCLAGVRTQRPSKDETMNLFPALQSTTVGPHMSDFVWMTRGCFHV